MVCLITNKGAYMDYKFKLSRIHCAGCALALEENINEIEGVSAQINFVTRHIKIKIDTENPAETLTAVKITISKFDHSIELLDAEDEDADEKREKLERVTNIARFSVSLILLIVGFLLEVSWVKILFCAVAYFLAAYDVLWGAILNVKNKNIFDEKLLMSIASLGAFVIGEFVEAVFVMLLFGVGEILENLAVDRSKHRIKSILDIRQPYANLYDGENTTQVEIDKIAVGDFIIVKPGEKVPLDGVIIEGTSHLDVSALTGETKERVVTNGDKVLSGSINGSSVLKIKVTSLAKDSTVSRIIDMVQNATETKAKSEKFISKFSKIYTPVVLGAAVFLAFIPPIFSGYANFLDYAYRALCFLVVSCPCALVISVPLTYFAGIGALSRAGVLVKGANYIEVLSKVDSVIFDKTGTLTKGEFEVTEIYANGEHTEDEVVELVAYAENFSNHKIARSVKKYYKEKFSKKPINMAWIEDYEEIAGKGIKATIFMSPTLVGNAKLLKENEIRFVEVSKPGTVLYVASGDEFVGYVVIEDTLKPDSKRGVQELKNIGIKRVSLSTGDETNVAKAISAKIGLNNFYADLLPEDKVAIIEKEIESKKTVAFVGDGINDAPSLAKANVGISMGGFGSDVAIEASDVVVMTDEPSKVATAIKKSKRIHKIATQNIVGAIAIKAIVLGLVGFNLAGMWLAVFADVGVSLLAVLNALRAMLK
ncbi:MAG: heavy metal translocating P-type ATPase [Clostridiales bacterium]|nr:heavy metal translocating P-type ATPase [Clostridiales bacterium]